MAHPVKVPIASSLPDLEEEGRAIIALALVAMVLRTKSPLLHGLVHPVDLNACVTIDGSEYKFCSKCVYRGTNQVGFYTTGPCMHSTSEHAASSTDSQGSEANIGAAAPAVSEVGHLLPTAPELDPTNPDGMYVGGRLPCRTD